MAAHKRTKKLHITNENLFFVQLTLQYSIIDVQINGGGGALDLYSTEQRSAGSGWNSWFTSSIAKLASGDYVTINLRNASGTYPFHQNNGRWGHYSIYLIG